ncbi:hypothetical protein QJQ45_016414 [Haematococcus lacustris]|nr:hypothetical protein QJQ45_016414 [Haematococcus lacustris]
MARGLGGRSCLGSGRHVAGWLSELRTSCAAPVHGWTSANVASAPYAAGASLANSKPRPCSMPRSSPETRLHSCGAAVGPQHSVLYTCDPTTAAPRSSALPSTSLPVPPGYSTLRLLRRRKTRQLSVPTAATTAQTGPGSMDATTSLTEHTDTAAEAFNPAVPSLFPSHSSDSVKQTEGSRRPQGRASSEYRNPGPGGRGALANLTPADAVALLQQRGVVLPQYCCGCGIKLQMNDPQAAGFFIIPVKLLEEPKAPKKERDADAGVAADAVDDAELQDYAQLFHSSSLDAQVAGQAAPAGFGLQGFADDDELKGDAGLPDVICQRCYSLRHAGCEAVKLDYAWREHASTARSQHLEDPGKVKVQEAESDMPGFDLARKVGRKIALQKDRRAVVLACVDAADFDGSLPRVALASLYPPGYVDLSRPAPSPPSEDGPGSREGPRGSSLGRVRQPALGREGGEVERRGEEEEGPGVRFKLMLALNKVDLLPEEASRARLLHWVRTRMEQAGLPRPDKAISEAELGRGPEQQASKGLGKGAGAAGQQGPREVFCVSAAKGLGVRALVEGVRDSLGYRGDLWVVGAQNAGKSSLIAAMKRVGGTGGQRDPTVAPLPGTTLGLINVPGLPLGAKNRAFDTPGVAHTHQLTALLKPEEVKQVLPTRTLLPRTFRLGHGSSLLLGGLARVDVVEHPGATLYLTVWASAHINLHLGKTEGVEQRLQRHVGGLLTPPASLERWRELPAWKPRNVTVTGDAWDRSTVDVHIAGLGWVAVGVSGRAQLRVWTFDSVAVTTRQALMPDYARDFCRPGFTQALPISAGKSS